PPPASPLFPYTTLFRSDLYLETMEQTYCAKEDRFLPDRYVEGTCPYCGYDKARGDQCDNCGRSLDPVELIGPRCHFDGTTPERRDRKSTRLNSSHDQIS